MASLSFVLFPLLLFAASLLDARPQYHLGKTAGRSDGEWSKRRFHGKDDYSRFLAAVQKKAGLRPEQDYMEFLVGDKRNQEMKSNDAYWDFVGADAKRTDRKKRSSDVIRQKTHPTNTGGVSEEQRSSRRLDPRSPPDGVESWEDFVLGKRTPARNEDVIDEDKRGISDYDYAEFVLGKRT